MERIHHDNHDRADWRKEDMKIPAWRRILLCGGNLGGCGGGRGNGEDSDTHVEERPNTRQVKTNSTIGR